MDKFLKNPLWKSGGLTAVLGCLIGAIGAGVSGHGIIPGAVIGLALGGFVGLFGQEMK
jgi:hypothetical protein